MDEKPNTTIELPFTPEDVRKGTTPRARHFDLAWKLIMDDNELQRARQKLSIHELRKIVNHVIDASS